MTDINQMVLNVVKAASNETALVTVLMSPEALGHLLSLREAAVAVTRKGDKGEPLYDGNTQAIDLYPVITHAVLLAHSTGGPGAVFHVHG